MFLHSNKLPKCSFCKYCMGTGMNKINIVQFVDKAVGSETWESIPMPLSRLCSNRSRKRKHGIKYSFSWAGVLNATEPKNKSYAQYTRPHNKTYKIYI